MKFKVEVCRERYEYVTVEVEASSYQEASFFGRSKAQNEFTPDWVQRLEHPAKYFVVSTDLVHEADCQCGWVTCPAKEKS